MIGRQRLNLGASELADALAEFDLASDRATATELHTADARFADSLFRFLGASEVHSLDNSAYQGAGFVHDLNTPIPRERNADYTAVVDCGTLEHIFDVPQALRNCMSMVAEGGHYLCVVPSNNFLGHGFYQFSPEFFFRALSPASGFTIRSCVVFTDDTIGRWYSVADPDSIGQRVTLTNASPTYIAVLAERIGIVELLDPIPQQSDYVKAWEETERTPTTIGTPSSSSPLARFTGLIPDAIKNPVRRRLAGARRRLNRRVSPGFDSAFFTRVRPTALSQATEPNADASP